MKNFTEIFNDEHISQLSKQKLFDGLTNEEIYLFILHSKPLYTHLQAGKNIPFPEKYKKFLTLIFTGNIFVFHSEHNGTKNLLYELKSGVENRSLFTMYNGTNELIEFFADDESDIILINPHSITDSEKSLALIQQKMLVNLIQMQRKAVCDLNEHIACISQRSIKDKVIKYLKIQIQKQQTNEITIPFSREQLADYLAIDRASLSRTLGELKRDGFIDFNKNHFIILQNLF